MEAGKCTKQYPRPFQPATVASEGSYPLYRRCEGPTVQVRGKSLDNRYVWRVRVCMCTCEGVCCVAGVM